MTKKKSPSKGSPESREVQRELQVKSELLEGTLQEFARTTSELANLQHQLAYLKIDGCTGGEFVDKRPPPDSVLLSSSPPYLSISSGNSASSDYGRNDARYSTGHASRAHTNDDVVMLRNSNEITEDDNISMDLISINRRMRDILDEEEVKRKIHNQYRAELQEAWDKLVNLRSHLSTFQKTIDEAAVEEARSYAFAHSTRIWETPGNNQGFGYSGTSMKTTMAVESTYRLADMQTLQQKLPQRELLRSQVKNSEEQLKRLRSQLERKSESLALASKGVSSGDTSSTSISLAMELRQSLLQVSRDLEATESEYVRSVGELEVLEEELSVCMRGMSLPEAMLPPPPSHTKPSDPFAYPPTPASAYPLPYSPSPFVAPGLVHTPSLLGGHSEKSAADTSMLNTGVITSQNEQKSEEFMDSVTSFSLHEVLSGNALVHRLNGEHAYSYRMRLEKRLQALKLLEKQLMIDVEAAADMVKSSMEALRDCEVRRLRLQLHLANAEGLSRQLQLEDAKRTMELTQGAARDARFSSNSAPLMLMPSASSSFSGRSPMDSMLEQGRDIATATHLLREDFSADDRQVHSTTPVPRSGSAPASSSRSPSEEMQDHVSALIRTKYDRDRDPSPSGRVTPKVSSSSSSNAASDDRRRRASTPTPGRVTFADSSRANDEIPSRPASAPTRRREWEQVTAAKAAGAEAIAPSASVMRKLDKLSIDLRQQAALLQGQDELLEILREQQEELEDIRRSTEEERRKAATKLAAEKRIALGQEAYWDTKLINPEVTGSFPASKTRSISASSRRKSVAEVETNEALSITRPLKTAIPRGQMTQTNKSAPVTTVIAPLVLSESKERSTKKSTDTMSSYSKRRSKVTLSGDVSKTRKKSPLGSPSTLSKKSSPKEKVIINSVLRPKKSVKKTDEIDMKQHSDILSVTSSVLGLGSEFRKDLLEYRSKIRKSPVSKKPQPFHRIEARFSPEKSPPEMKLIRTAKTRKSSLKNSDESKSKTTKKKSTTRKSVSPSEGSDHQSQSAKNKGKKVIKRSKSVNRNLFESDSETESLQPKGEKPVHKDEGNDEEEEEERDEAGGYMKSSSPSHNYRSPSRSQNSRDAPVSRGSSRATSPSPMHSSVSPKRSPKTVRDTEQSPVRSPARNQGSPERRSRTASPAARELPYSPPSLIPSPREVNGDITELPTSAQMLEWEKDREWRWERDAPQLEAALLDKIDKLKLKWEQASEEETVDPRTGIALDDRGLPKGSLEITVVCAKELPEMKRTTRSADAYVEIWIAGAGARVPRHEDRLRTSTKWKSRYPEWREQLSPLRVNDLHSALWLEVRDATKLGKDQIIGDAAIPLSMLMDQVPHTLWVKIREHALLVPESRTRPKMDPNCSLQVKVKLSFSKVAQFASRMTSLRRKLSSLRAAWAKAEPPATKQKKKQPANSTARTGADVGNGSRAKGNSTRFSQSESPSSALSERRMSPKRRESNSPPTPSPKRSKSIVNKRLNEVIDDPDEGEEQDLKPVRQQSRARNEEDYRHTRKQRSESDRSDYADEDENVAASGSGKIRRIGNTTLSKENTRSTSDFRPSTATSRFLRPLKSPDEEETFSGDEVPSQEKLRENIETPSARTRRMSSIIGNGGVNSNSYNPSASREGGGGGGRLRQVMREPDDGDDISEISIENTVTQISTPDGDGVGLSGTFQEEEVNGRERVRRRQKTSNQSMAGASTVGVNLSIFKRAGAVRPEVPRRKQIADKEKYDKAQRRANWKVR